MPSASKNSAISFDERSAARDRDSQPIAEPLLHLRVDEPVGEPALQLEARRHRQAALAQRAHLRADAQRPVDDPPLGARLLVELRAHGRVHLLVHARHARQHRRPHLEQRLGRAKRIRKERDRVADVRPREMHQPPEVVRERQVEQQDVVGRREVLELVDDGDHLVVVAVADHARLRRAGRAGRVDVREEVVLAHLRGRVAQRFGMLARVCAPALAQLVELGERPDVRQSRAARSSSRCSSSSQSAATASECETTNCASFAELFA